MDTFLLILLWTGLVLLWSLQYLLIAPTVWACRVCWRVLASLTKLGLVGLILLCVPVVGWIILIIMVWNRLNGPQRASVNAGLWRPWFAHLVTGRR